jgi:branched-chain amino acid transport system ATP-binding protein
MEPFRIADQGVTRTFQNIRLFKNLSVYDNVFTACHLSAKYSLPEAILRLPRFRREEKLLKEKAQLLEIAGLQDRSNVVASNLPYGLQRRLEIVRAWPLIPAAAPGRAGRWHEPGRDGTVDAADSRYPQPLQAVGAGDRAPYGSGHGLCERIVVLNFGIKLAEGRPERDPR